jgi:MoxR-like ATPase
MSSRETILELRRRLGESLFGQDHVRDALLLALLADGHVLTEMAPGDPKPVRALYPHLDASYSHIQFTSDLLPSDLTYTGLYCNKQADVRDPRGPLWANLILADDLNLGPPDTQAVLLEAMEDRRVRGPGTSYPLPEGVFLVQAFENTFVQEETFPLTWAQLDHFLVKIVVPSPSDDDLMKMCLLACEERAGRKKEQPRLPQQAILDAQAEAREVFLPVEVERGIAGLIAGTRRPPASAPHLGRWIQKGAGPRGGRSLARCARARAWLAGRGGATLDDVRAVAHDCLRHRIDLSPEAHAAGVAADQVITELLDLAGAR